MKVDNPKKTQAALYKKIVDTISEESPIAIVGAGSSVRMGYPNWNGLLELLSTQAVQIDPSQRDKLSSLQQDDPLVCASEIKKILGSVEYYSQLEKIFGPLVPECDLFHKLIVSLPFSHFLTTNYDRVLQVAHEKSATEPYVELDLEDHNKNGNLFDAICSNAAKRHFIHAHGSVKNPQNMILALEDYNERYVRRNDLTEFLKLLFTRRIIFWGFSLSDEEFLGPLKFLTACFGTGEARHFAVLPKSDRNGDIAALRTKYRSRYRIESLFYDPKDNHAILIPFLEELVADVKDRQNALIREKIPFLKSLCQQQGKDASVLLTIQDIERIERSTIDSKRIDITSPDFVTRTALDLEIDTIFSYVKNGHPEIAIEMYEAILKREGEGLSKRLMYRLHANIGNALNSMNRHKEASRKYLTATKYWNETKESQALQALGYILIGDYSRSSEITDRVCREHPDYPRAYALRLRSIHGKFSFKEARKSVPLKIRRDPEVAYALSVIAHEQELYKRSEIYSKIAWQSSPDWTAAGLLFATAILISEKSNSIICGGTKLIPRNIDRVREVESVLTSLLAKLKESDPANMKGILLYNRASAKRLLGLDSEARSDIAEAFHYDRNNPEVVGAYALQCERDGHRDEAIDILESHEGTEDHADLSFLLSSMLFQRSFPTDLARALSILMPWCEKVDKITPASHRCDFLLLISRILVKSKRTEDAISLVNNTLESDLPSRHKQLVLLWIQIQSETVNPDDAKRTCEEVAAAMSNESEYFIIRHVAICADRIAHHSLSFNVWKRITSPHDFNEDTISLLQAAHNSKAWEFIIDFCAQLRQNGIHDRNGYISEIQANIECHEFNEALRLLVTWLSREPDDKEMRMNLSLLAFETGNEGHIEGDPDKLPAVIEVPSAQYGTVVVQVLRQAGSVRAAIEYAYELWRKFPDEILAQHALIATVVESESDEIILARPNKVKCDCAILIKAVDADGSRAHIIETGPSPSMARSEYSPNHKISKALLKRKIGDIILIGGRKWSVLEIHSKYAYRASCLLKDFNIDFPNNPLLREFRVPTQIEASSDLQEELAEIKAFMLNADKRQRTLENLYQRGSLPIVTFAQAMCKSVLETMMYYAASPDHKILVCSDVTIRYDVALKILSRNCKIVLDETAVATLFILGLYKDLGRLPYELIIPETLVNEIRRVSRFAAFNRRSSLFLGILNGNLTIQRVSPTQHANWINSLEELLAFLHQYCTVEGGKSLLAFKPPKREELIQALGPVTADAIAIAKETGAIFWTDDLLSRELASAFKIQNVWSQVALQYTRNVDKTFASTYNKAEKNMFLWGYDFTVVRLTTIISVFSDAKWNVNDNHLKYVLNFIGRLGGLNKHNCQLTCLLIVRIWLTKSLKRKKAREIITLILEKIGRDISGPQIARVIYRNQLKLPNNQKIKSLKRMLRTWRTKR